MMSNAHCHVLLSRDAPYGIALTSLVVSTFENSPATNSGGLTTLRIPGLTPVTGPRAPPHKPYYQSLQFAHVLLAITNSLKSRAL
jgi:hypothetical protein